MESTSQSANTEISDIPKAPCFINERIRSVSWEWWKQRSVNDRGLAFRTEPPAYVHNEDSGLIHFLRDVWITLYFSDVLLKPVSHQRLNADKKWNGSAFKNHVQIKFPEEDYYHYYHYYYYFTFSFLFFRSVRPPRRFVFTTTVVIIVETEKIPSCRGARWCERLCKHATLSLPRRTQWKYIWMVHKSYKAIPLCQGRKRLLCQTEADYYTSAGGDKSSQITTFFGGGQI